MQLFLQIIIFIVGVILTIKGGDIFVSSATNISKKFKVPSFIIGATLVSFATTLPELVVSLTAAASGKTDMAIGNAVGSVIANTALILGISFIFAKESKKDKYKTLRLLLLVALFLVLLFSEINKFNLVVAIMLLLVFLSFVISNLKEAKNEENDELEEEIAMAKKAKKDIIFFLIGAMLVFIGSRIMVNSGTFIAEALKVSERVISLTLLAVGTSLPELVTTITAIIKKNPSLSIGNIIGANIINLTLILPLCTLVSGSTLEITKQTAQIDIPVCLTVCFLGIMLITNNKVLRKLQGVSLIIIYIIYLFNIVG